MRSMSRRNLGQMGIGLAASILMPVRAFAGRAGASGPRVIARVIVDNDFAGDPDGLAALAYQLVAQTAKTVLVTSSAIDPKLAAMAGTLPVGRTAAHGAALTRTLIGIARTKTFPLVVSGSETFGVGSAQVTDAARAIVAEARKSDALPLIVTCGGPLTNIAAALRLDPSIAGCMTVIWIGGRADLAGGEEYNLSTDVAAARQVIERSGVPFWQVPVEAYAPLLISRTEMDSDLRPISSLTAWLFDKLIDLPSFVPPTGVKGLGDCALVPLASVSPDCGHYSARLARRIRDDSSYGEEISGRPIRVYSDIDRRLTIADMLASLRSHARAGHFKPDRFAN